MAESVVTRPLVERRAQIVYPGEPGHDPGNSAAPAPADTVVEPAFVLKLLKNLYPVVGYGVDASGAEVDITTFAPDDEALERLWELSARPGAAALMVAHDAVPLSWSAARAQRCDHGRSARGGHAGQSGGARRGGGLQRQRRRRGARRARPGRAVRAALGTAHAGC